MRKFCFDIFLFAIALASSLAAFCQEPAFKNYTTAQGLSSNNVYSVIQDDEGFIWFATDNGVSRFDGTKFKNFTVADGLSDNSVLRVAKDSRGRLWFLTFNGKLSYYKGGKIYNSSNDSLLAKVKFTNAISNFFEDSRKNIWMSSIDRSIIKISNKNEVTKHKYIESHTIFEGENDTVYSLTSIGISKFKDNEYIYKGSSFNLTSAVPFPCDSLILLATVKGLAIFNINNYTIRYVSRPEKLKNSNIQGLFIENNKNIWIAIINGVIEYDGGIISSDHEHKYFNNYSISSVFKDLNDNLWFTSIGSGVFIVPSLSVRSFDTKSGLAEDNISSVAVLKKDLIMTGTHNGSIQLIDKGEVKKNTRSMITPSGSIIKIIKDSKNVTWILTNAALIRYYEGKFKILDSYNYSWGKTIFVSHDGTLWIGWGRGIRKVINNKVEPVFEDTSVNRFYAINEIGNDMIFGSDRGLYRYHNGKMIYEGEKDTLLAHRINSLTVTNDSVIWIATNSYGLLSISRGVVNSYTVKDHLLSNHCNALLADGDKVYLGTDKGLNVAHRKNNKAELISYSSVNGLLCGSINEVIKEKENTFIMATDEGVVEFNQVFLRDESLYLPYINAIIVNDVPLPSSSSYTFSYNENNIQFDFGAINYNSDGNILYRYRLNGIDSGWNFTTSAIIKYSNLKPGNYTFLVGVNDSIHNLTSKVISINLFIETPWWQTWWFKIIIILVSVCVIALLIKWRFDSYKKKMNARSAQAESELKALRSQINPHFIYNSLNSIQDFIMQNQKDDASLHLAKFARLMRNILSHSRKPKITLAEEIESLKLYLELESLRFSNRFTFQFKIDEQIDPLDVYIPSMILQPYIENAIIHGLSTKEEGGKIDIIFSRKNDFLLCIIEDNGIGRKRARELKMSKLRTKDESLGMKITEERLNLLSAQEKRKINLEVNDLIDDKNIPCGTRVTIYFFLGGKQ